MVNHQEKALFCNGCGRELKKKNGIYREDFVRIQKKWGYFSSKDTENHSLTLCEAIVRYAKHHIISRFMLNHHHELYCDKSLRYELVNFRAQRQNTRDIMQDLADTAAGIEVVHQVDADRLQKEQKQARKQVRQAQKIRSLEKLVLAGNLDHLTCSQRKGLEKYLSEERIAELMEQRGTAAEQVQMSLFG